MRERRIKLPTSRRTSSVARPSKPPKKGGGGRGKEGLGRSWRIRSAFVSNHHRYIPSLSCRKPRYVDDDEFAVSQMMRYANEDNNGFGPSSITDPTPSASAIVEYLPHQAISLLAWFGSMSCSSSYRLQCKLLCRRGGDM